QWPGTRGESGAYHTEIYRVGGACRGSKGHALDFGDRSTDLLGDDQVGPCDIGFIEIVVICPTQDCSQSVATEAAERATRHHLGICCTCSQHACIGGHAGPAAGDLPCVASDCKVGGEMVGIGSPLITVGGSTPQRLIRAREIVLSNSGSRCCRRRHAGRRRRTRCRCRCRCCYRKAIAKGTCDGNIVHRYLSCRECKLRESKAWLHVGPHPGSKITGLGITANNIDERFASCASREENRAIPLGHVRTTIGNTVGVIGSISRNALAGRAVGG